MKHFNELSFSLKNKIFKKKIKIPLKMGMKSNPKILLKFLECDC